MRPEWNRHLSLDILHENCLEPAAYLIPYHSAAAALSEREESRRFQLLSGTWDFRFYPALYEVEDFIAEPDARTDWDEIPVPLCWQVLMDRGYDRPFYGDSKFPMPVDPPHVPTKNPCGLYRRFFTVEKEALEGEVQLRFDGVDSCFYLYLNGKYVGYSQVSHSSSVFNVTPFLREGENEIRVLVLKWCDGIYLEDQDKIRLSGIFRDVYLLYREKAHLADLYVRPFVSEDLSRAELTAELTLTSPQRVCWSLFDPEGDLVAQGETEGRATEESFSLALTSPALWCDEIPRLYRLALQAGEEYFSQDVGFRRLEIKNNCVLINGKKVKGKGANRHDSDPNTGYAVTLEHMLRDLYILKQNNMNMVRASHYPNDPRFLTLCDRLGFYVCDEADLETHGLDFIEGMGRPYLTDDPAWTEAYLDRARRMMEQDKNHTSVIFWSVGNECGIGQNLVKEAEYFHERMPGCIVHSERFNFIQHRLYIEDPKVKGLEKYVQEPYMDIDSRMYATPDDCRRYMADPDRARPFFLCEYCHSMGNSPGDLKEYWDIIYANDAFFGGCIWELTDHAVNVGTPEEPKYLYGGDFGDEPNRANFCADGLVWPDRRLHSGMLEYRRILSPAEPLSFHEKTGALTLKNRRYFTDLSDLALLWSIEEEGRVIASGRIASLAVAPQSVGEISLPVHAPEKEIFTALNLDFVTNCDTPWAKAGHVVSTAQFVLQEEAAPVALEPVGKVKVTEEERFVTVSDGKTSYRFDKNRGLLVSLADEGGEYLAEPLDFTLYRAPTDNDLYVRELWAELGLHRAATDCRAFAWQAEEERATLTAHLIYGAVAAAVLGDVFVTYTVTAGQGVAVSLRFVLRRKIELTAPRTGFTLPRVGMQCSVTKGLETLRFFGLGPMAAYQDKRLAARMGLYETSVTEHVERYIKPQENMAHAETRFFTLEDEKGRGLRFEGTEEFPRFSFNASHFSPKDLAETRHDFELVPRKETVVNIDLAQCGIGSNSCGPTLPAPFVLNDMEYRFSFRIKSL